MTPEEKISTSGSDVPKMPERLAQRAVKLLIAIVIISVIAGSAAGFTAGILAVRLSQQASSSSSKQFSTTNKNASGNPAPQNPSAFSSGIVDVVKKASPAVVSITVSQKTSDIQQSQTYAYGSGDGSGGDGSELNPPFGFFGLIDPYFNGSQNQSNGNSSTGNGNTDNNSTSNEYQEVAAGSGFFVSSDGLILTNKHVVSLANAEYTVTTSDGKTYDATVAATDPINDLALVKISINNAPTLQLSDSSTIEIGQQVIAIGNSLGEYQNTVTSGIVLGIGRNITAGSDEGDGSDEELDGVIQTDAAINPGNSGGPLLNSAGQVIGVNTAVDQEGQLVGFAIPSDFAAKDISSFQSQGKIIKPFLGLSYISIDADSQKVYNLPVSSGAYITASAGSSAIVAGSAADKAGLKPGDIITAVNGQAIDSTHTLSQLLQQFNPGDKITVSILRDGKKLSISVTLGSK